MVVRRVVRADWTCVLGSVAAGSGDARPPTPRVVSAEQVGDVPVGGGCGVARRPGGPANLALQRTRPAAALFRQSTVALGGPVR